jgi:4-amino-4-deoxy-L-arabinose transferase-like glycosyltransferase
MTLSDLSRQAIKHRSVFFLLLGALLYAGTIALRDLWYPDELDIAEVARAMFVSGDWISPRRMGVIWVDYPPMIYWVGTLSSHVFGEMSAFSLRLPNALAAIVTVIITGIAAKRWFDGRTALWAGFALLTFLSFVYEANSYRPDVFFTLMITAGITSYADGVGDRPRLMFRALAFVFFGLAMLSKGPLGLLLPGLVLVLWLGTQRQWRRIIELAPLSLIAIAVYLPWFVATSQAMGWDSMLYEFYAQNLERFLTSEHRGHAQPWFYYIRNFWLDFAPWSWLFPAAVIWLVRSGRWRERKVQLALWWFGTFFVFLSIAATKRQLYLLPAYPAAALLLGPWLASFGQTTKSSGQETAPSSRPVRIYSLILSIFYAAIGTAIIGVLARLSSIIPDLDLNEQELQVVENIRWPLVLLSVVFLVSAVAIWRAWRRNEAGTALVRIGGTQVAIYVAILAFVLPAFGPTKTYAPQSHWISEQIGDETHFGMVDPAGVGRRGGFSYYTGTMVDLLEGPAEVERFFRDHPASVVLIIEGSVDQVFAGNESAWRARTMRELRVGSHLYLVVRGPQQF